MSLSCSICPLSLSFWCLDQRQRRRSPSQEDRPSFQLYVLHCPDTEPGARSCPTGTCNHIIASISTLVIKSIFWLLRVFFIWYDFTLIFFLLYRLVLATVYQFPGCMPDISKGIWSCTLWKELARMQSSIWRWAIQIWVLQRSVRHDTDWWWIKGKKWTLDLYNASVVLVGIELAQFGIISAPPAVQTFLFQDFSLLLFHASLVWSSYGYLNGTWDRLLGKNDTRCCVPHFGVLGCNLPSVRADSKEMELVMVKIGEAKVKLELMSVSASKSSFSYFFGTGFINQAWSCQKSVQRLIGWDFSLKFKSRALHPGSHIHSQSGHHEFY